MKATKCSLLRFSPRQSSVSADGFSLAEVLITVAIIGILASIATQGFLFLLRRERLQSVSLASAGWIELVRNSAANRVSANSSQGGCEVNFSTSASAVGDQLASVSGCSVPEPILRIPGELQNDTVTVTTSLGNPLIFTPRGLWTDASGAPGASFQLDLVLNGGGPRRCVRLTPTLGSVELGRSNSDAACDQWQTL